MITRKLVLVAFVLTAAAELGVLAGAIERRGTTLARGAVYRFVTRPVDPYDPFRGRYVALAFEQTSAAVPPGISLTRRQRVFVPLEIVPDGFTRLGAVSLTRPPGGDYLAADAVPTGDSVARIVLPFDRYYLNERAAPAAEALYRRARGNTWVTVRVRSGRAVLEELFIDGVPVLDAVAAAGASP